MNIWLKALAIILLALGISTSKIIAGEANLKDDGSATWQAGVDGVEIEWNPNGSVKRVYSKYSTPVEFSDRRGIAKAQVIAEEKAKAGIIRFFQQNVSSTRIVAELQADLNKATQERQSGASATVKKIDQRTLAESLTEVTTSFASGTLRGVIVLEKGYDDKIQEAWAVVGISEKTMKAARAAQDMTANPSGNSSSGAADSIGTQKGEVRRSKQKNW
jgi:hypothetical protein